MITSHQQEKLKRDVHQLDLWIEEYHKDLPEEMKQDLKIEEAYQDLKGSISLLRKHFEDKAGAC